MNSNESPSKGQARGSDEHRGGTAQSGDHKGGTAQSEEGQSKGTAQSKGGASEKQNRDAAQSKDNQRTGQMERNGKNNQANERKDESHNTGSTARSDTKLSSDQKTKVRQHFGSEIKSKSITNVNFSISVGTVVPRSVHVYTVPADIVEIVPAYRGYKYVVVRDEILILEPDTLRIVAIIDA
jgi:hypothetical protein